MNKQMNGIAKVRGVKNQRPVVFAFVFIEAKNKMLKRAIQKLFSVFLQTKKNNARAERQAQIAGRNLQIRIKFIFPIINMIEARKA